MKRLILILCFVCLPVVAKQGIGEQKSIAKAGFVIIRFDGRDYLANEELGVICYNSRMATRELVCVRIKVK